MASTTSFRCALLIAARRRRARRQPRRTPGRGVAVTAVLFGVVTLIAGLISGGAAYYGQVTSSEASAAEVIAGRAGGARIYDRNGILLYEFLNEGYGFQRRAGPDLALSQERHDRDGRCQLLLQPGRQRRRAGACRVGELSPR
jgi:hypothetical protein